MPEIKFIPHPIREREYEIQRGERCIGHIWKYHNTWQTRMGEHFSQSRTLASAKAMAREFANVNTNH